MTVLGEGQWTPAPWINVVANPALGFQVSESGAGYTWSVNSRENKLTPWSNDPVTDAPGETIYVRDEDTGALWGPTALPIGRTIDLLCGTVRATPIRAYVHGKAMQLLSSCRSGSGED